MYTLYHLPGSCSLVTLTLLLKMKQAVKLTHRDSVQNYRQINPVGAVPALTNEQGTHLLEGGAIVLHLLAKHDVRWQAMADNERQVQTQNLFFANATMHPAYNRLFFLNRVLPEGDARQTAQKAAADAIVALWRAVEDRLHSSPFLGGDEPSAADVMLTVYSRWGNAFPVSIEIGSKCQQMIEKVTALPSFKRALEMEAELR